MCLNHAAPAPAPSAAADAKRLIVDLDSKRQHVRLSDGQTGETLCELDSPLGEPGDGGDPDAATAAVDRLTTALLEFLQPSGPPPVLHARGTIATARALTRRGDSQGTQKSRRKLWQLAHKLHCPVIGTCLDADELRRIARKAGAQANGELSDYDVHVSFVASADGKNRLSIATHKALERKFARQVKQFSRVKHADELATAWADGLARGDVPGAMWATLTHPLCDDALKSRVFEAVHMLSHQIGAGQRADLKRLSEVEHQLQTLQRDFDSAQKRLRRQLEAREQRIAELDRELATAQQERRLLQASQSQMQHDLAALRATATPGEVDRLAAELFTSERAVAALRQQAEALEAALASAERKLAQAQAAETETAEACAAMERFITQSLEICDNCAAADACGDPDLGGRRILCVGGRNQMIEHYRELVTRCNGRFEHYDGGKEDNRQRLDALLSSADAVVCATDSVSHDAYYRLKRFCKRTETPHVFLRSSGISSFARALYGMTPHANDDR
jgi:hypothetical protein